MLRALQQAKSKIAGRRAARPDATSRPGWFAGNRRAQALRERFEALAFADQFRVAAIVAVLVTLAGVQLMVTVWDAAAERYDNRATAHRLVEEIGGHVAESGPTDALDGLAYERLVLAGQLLNSDGDVLERYGDAAGPLPRRNWPHPALRVFGFEPDYVEVPVEIAGWGEGTLGIQIDNAPPWRAALSRIVQAPFVFALGFLLAVLAANALRRQVAEPLVQLARSTRPGEAKGAATPADAAEAPGNELNEIAANFESMNDRLLAYERELTNLRVATRREVVDRTRDIEQRLRKAEALTSSKDEFLANMSHEIRTPMNGVLGMAELLAGTDLDKRQRRYVDSMRSAAETMMQIINDILDDSKIEAGKMDLVREAFDVREFAEQVGEVFAGRAETKKLELICRVEPTVPTSVIGDVLRLRQVLGNLVSNAVKYTQQGEIQVRIGLDALNDDQCRLHFSVADTGPGIPEADQPTVFEAFSQLGNAQRIGGTGLGLSIATRLVKLMGGDRIDLWSQVGKGSSFSFVLPFAVHEAAPAPDAASDEFTGMRVLVVEDSPTIYMQIEEALSNWSADVTIATNGRMVRERLREAAARGRPFDAVLLDHSLPDSSTQDLLREIRLDPAISRTYVVLLSAFDFDTAYEGEQAIAPDTCVAKPVRMKLLRGALRSAREPRAAAGTHETSELRAPVDPPPGDLPSLGLDVLVADDNVINREVAQAMLERCGCKVALAEDGSVALDQVRRRRFDVVLMDCQMPNMDGFAATAAIRRIEAEIGMKPTVIVALTANVLARDRNRCTEAGMDRFLAKPFSQEQLVAVLKPIAEERGTMRQAPPVAAVAPTPPARRAALAPVPTTAPAPVVTATQTLEEDLLADAFTEVVDEKRWESVGSAADEPEEALLSDTIVLDMLELPAVDAAASEALPVLDAEQIAAIRGLGKPQVLERLCELLYGTAPDSMAKLAAALEAGDLESISSVCHTLKSPVGSLGGRRLADQLDRCETAARDGGDLAGARRLARGMKQNYLDLVAALKAETGRPTGT
jgi:signal transduction histidine kinase/DNA-binding response OmpR family regulator/HPt (histidine-containing phosphotransfer) domain-containing protein